MLAAIGCSGLVTVLVAANPSFFPSQCGSSPLRWKRDLHTSRCHPVFSCGSGYFCPNIWGLKIGFFWLSDQLYRRHTLRRYCENNSLGVRAAWILEENLFALWHIAPPPSMERRRATDAWQILTWAQLPIRAKCWIQHRFANWHNLTDFRQRTHPVDFWSALPN